MKICPDHWARLRAAIDERGLSHLVARSGKEATDRIVAQLEHSVEHRESLRDAMRKQDEAASFDPLLGANFAIFSNALEAGGLYLMTPDEQGQPRCPLCELAKHVNPVAVDEWLRLSADGALEKARELGLVPAQQ